MFVVSKDTDEPDCGIDDFTRRLLNPASEGRSVAIIEMSGIMKNACDQ